jgi:putative hydrolase of the HAD superfamily
VDLDWYFRECDSSRLALPVIIFDGDDTLWMTEALYDTARGRSADLVAGVGLDPAQFEKVQREIDLSNFDRYGLSQMRFPKSSRDAYLTLTADAGRAASDELAQAVYDASAHVFDAPAPLAVDVEETLRGLRDRYRITVLTKGDASVQRRRVDDSGLAPLLDAVVIVEVKDEPVFAEVLRQVTAEAASSWSVGNSYGSDVHPAVMAGMRAIWIEADVWAHERSISERVLTEDDPNVFVAEGLREIPAIVEGQPVRRPGQ